MICGRKSGRRKITGGELPFDPYSRRETWLRSPVHFFASLTAPLIHFDVESPADIPPFGIADLVTSVRLSADHRSELVYPVCQWLTKPIKEDFGEACNLGPRAQRPADPSGPAPGAGAGAQ